MKHCILLLLVLTLTIPALASGELKHRDVGAEIGRDEWNAANTHQIDGGQTGDLLYQNYTGNLARLAIGTSGTLLRARADGTPFWWIPTYQEAATALTSASLMQRALLADYATSGPWINGLTSVTLVDRSSLADNSTRLGGLTLAQVLALTTNSVTTVTLDYTNMSNIVTENIIATNTLGLRRPAVAEQVSYGSELVQDAAFAVSPSEVWFYHSGIDEFALGSLDSPWSIVSSQAYATVSGGLKQTLTGLTPGNSYRVSFNFLCGYSSSADTVVSSLGGTAGSTHTSPGDGLAFNGPFSDNIVAGESGVLEIVFSSTSNAAYISAVSVQERHITTAVPESWALYSDANLASLTVPLACGNVTSTGTIAAAQISATTGSIGSFSNRPQFAAGADVTGSIAATKLLAGGAPGAWDATSGQVAHWKMNDNADSADVADSAGSYTGTLTNGSNSYTSENTAAGKVGTGIAFNGSSDYITFPDITALDSSLFSFSFWVNPDSSALGSLQFIYIDNGADTNSQLQFAIMTDGKMRFVARDSASAFSPFLYSPASICDDNWHYVCGIRNNQTDFSLYVDGNLSTGSVEGFGTVAIGGGDAPVIGDYSVYFLKGAVDDFRIFSSVLTGSEVASLYNSGAGTEADYASYALDLLGDARFSGGITSQYALVTSDPQTKKDIKSLARVAGDADVLAAAGISFKFKGDKAAQDFEGFNADMLPARFVKIDKTGIKHLDFMAIIASQAGTIADLEKRVKKLEKAAKP